jgi:molybdenum cofactor cytidylyltransferase
MISAVVLAAGASTRMGAAKLLLPLGEETIVRRTVRQVCDAGFDEVVVVLGREPERTWAALEGLRVRQVVNPHYASGMGTSFRAGVEALDASEAAMFALADQPFVTADAYRQVLDAYLRFRPAIVSVRFGEVIAPPHLFTREFFPELARLDHGARDLLRRHHARAHVLHLSPGLLMDIDTPDDYDAAKTRLAEDR